MWSFRSHQHVIGRHSGPTFTLLFSFAFFSFSAFYLFFFVPVKTRAKSVRREACWAPGRCSGCRLLSGLRSHCCTVQTNSRGSPGCGIPFSVSPRDPSPPPGSPPVPSWRRSGSCPSSWWEKTHERGFNPITWRKEKPCVSMLTLLLARSDVWSAQVDKWHFQVSIKLTNPSNQLVYQPMTCLNVCWWLVAVSPAPSPLV